KSGGEPLMVYCAAGLREPMQAVADEYGKEFGVEVRTSFGASQAELVTLERAGNGDIYLPADESYVEMARGKGLVDVVMPVAVMRPVLGVKRGNSFGVKTLDEVLNSKMKLGQANPEAAAIGKVTRDALMKVGKWEAVAAKTVVFTGTVNEVANAVKVGSIDGGFIWDALLKQYADLEGVEIGELKDVSSKVAVVVLKTSKNGVEARKFARYLAARDRGLREFARFGFAVVEGDLWSARPELRLMSGAMLRPAIEETIADFEQREGVSVVRVYNGCGILVAAMRAGERPDAYFACDASFMEQVSDLFLDAVDVSQNQLVILVHKGNPKGIHSLRDLGQKDLKVGVGHEKQCALGVLTKETLVQTRQYEPVMKNVVVQSPTGDFLVNQLRTGSLDAVIAYVSNAAASGDKLEAIKIDIPCAIATQPFAVGRESPQKELGKRLLSAIRSAESKERFLENGFYWKGRGD
ncbi:MAG TPA: molybdate ABC transporter substrate-binding protein, partial [Tepidisphaeraceae bacterium]|nr:molybdate ABC transporter substrate-binding protein [Tepidisphaeraceae bacterium]